MSGIPDGHERGDDRDGLGGVAEEAAEVCTDACVGLCHGIMVVVGIAVRMRRRVLASSDMSAGYGQGVRTRFHRVGGIGTRFG